MAVKPGEVKITKDNTKAFEDAINALDLNRVLIGIPEANNTRKEEEGEEAFDGMSNAAIAYIQENGSDIAGIPARPFLIPGIREAQGELVSEMKRAARDSFTNSRAVTSGLTRAGIIGMNWVKSWINAGIGFDPLAESTLAARKADGFKGTKPLVRTAQMRNAITYVLEEGN